MEISTPRTKGVATQVTPRRHHAAMGDERTQHEGEEVTVSQRSLRQLKTEAEGPNMTRPGEKRALSSSKVSLSHSNSSLDISTTQLRVVRW